MAKSTSKGSVPVKSEMMCWSKSFVLTFLFHAGGEDAEVPRCKNSLCRRTCYPKEDGTYFDFCGETCRNLSQSQASSTPGVFSGCRITELIKCWVWFTLNIIHSKSHAASLCSLPGCKLPKDRQGRYDGYCGHAHRYQDFAGKGQ